MKISVTVCLSMVLCLHFTIAIAQQSPKDWYAKGLNAEFHTQKMEYFTKAIELDANYVEAYNGRATAKSDLGMLKEAILDFGQATRLDSTNVYAFFNRASCQFALGKYEESVADFNRVIQLKPAHAYAMSGKGCALALTGKYDEAIEILNQALWLEGSLQSAVKCREEALKQRDKHSNASPVANKTTKGQPAEGIKKTTKKSPTEVVNKTIKAQPAEAPTTVTAKAPSTLKLNIMPSLGEYKLTDATSLREGPIHTTRVLARFDAGDAVELLEKTDEFWWKVRYKGKVGYAKAAMLGAVN